MLVWNVTVGIFFGHCFNNTLMNEVSIWNRRRNVAQNATMREILQSKIGWN